MEAAASPVVGGEMTTTRGGVDVAVAAGEEQRRDRVGDRAGGGHRDHRPARHRRRIAQAVDRLGVVLQRQADHLQAA